MKSQSISVAAVCNLKEICVFHIVFQFPIGQNTFDIRFDSTVDTNMGVLKYFTVVSIKKSKNMLPLGLQFSSNVLIGQHFAAELVMVGEGGFFFSFYACNVLSLQCIRILCCKENFESAWENVTP